MYPATRQEIGLLKRIYNLRNGRIKGIQIRDGRCQVTGAVLLRSEICGSKQAKDPEPFSLRRMLRSPKVVWLLLRLRELNNAEVEVKVHDSIPAQISLRLFVNP